MHITWWTLILLSCRHQRLPSCVVTRASHEPHSPQVGPSEAYIRQCTASVVSRPNPMPELMAFLQDAKTHAEQKPHDLVANGNLALAYLMLRDYKAAEAPARKAYPGTQRHLAHVLFQLGRLEEAIPLMRRRVTNPPAGAGDDSAAMAELQEMEGRLPAPASQQVMHRRDGDRDGDGVLQHGRLMPCVAKDKWPGLVALWPCGYHMGCTERISWFWGEQAA